MMYSREGLEAMKAKELLAVAKVLQIVGRHDMKKSQLVDAIIARQNAILDLDEKIEADGGPSNYSGIEDDQPEIREVINEVQDDIEAELAKEGLKERWDGEVAHDFIPRVADKLPKPKTHYIENVKVGTIIAFKVGGHDNKLLSGKIEEINKSGFGVVTKTGVRFKVLKKNVVWVKTGDRWPRGVYLALKGETTVENKGNS